MDHCSACEVTATSLHVPPTHLRTVQALVELQELAISLHVSCLRAEPVDTCVLWISNTTGNNPSCPHSTPFKARTGTARQNYNNDLRSSACIQGSGTVTYQASSSDRPRQQTGNNPSDATSSAQPPEQITIIQTPSHKGQSTCFPLKARLG